jgi:phage terminase large subunit-like protein
MMKRPDPYLSGVDPAVFSPGEYIRSLDPANIRTLLRSRNARIAMTREDPLLFALLYFPKSITDKDTGVIELSDMHFDLCRLARTWMYRHDPMENRNAVLAPREAGKSTWLFKILPLWAAAHGHIRFVAAFTSTGPQAARWFTNVQRELDGNRLLREDYPDLCMPQVRASTGRAFTDTKTAYSSRSGATFFAAGIDSTNLGLNVDDARPDLILFDDIEPDESNYSIYQKQQRLITVIDTCMGMNLRAHVMFVGTVVMMGSIFHDFVTRNDGEETDENKWVEEEKISIHHFEPIVEEKDGTRRSIWPNRWPLHFLESIESTRSYAKNYANRPANLGGDYWDKADIRYGSLERYAIKVLSIDPATKDAKHNDFTAMAVVTYDPQFKRLDGTLGGYEVVDCADMHVVPGRPFVERVKAFLAIHPDIAVIIVETNQGGMVWRAMLEEEGLPVQIWEVTASEHKWTRAAKALTHYQDAAVFHRRKFARLEGQMLSFPKVHNDDLIDATGQAILELEARFALAANRTYSEGYSSYG